VAERPSLAAGFLFPNAGGKDSFFMNLKMVFSVIGLFFGILMLSGFLSEAGLNTFLVLLIDAAVFILVFRMIWKRKSGGDGGNKLIEEAKLYLQNLEQTGLIPINSHILLKKDESAYLAEESVLSETKAIRYHSSLGTGFRIMKGVYVGGSSGKAESRQEWRKIDRGLLTLTGQRLIFDGSQENRVISIAKIISINPYKNGMEISYEGKQKSVMFSVSNPYIWFGLINFIKNIEDPKTMERFEERITEAKRLDAGEK